MNGPDHARPREDLTSWLLESGGQSFDREEEDGKVSADGSGKPVDGGRGLPGDSRPGRVSVSSGRPLPPRGHLADGGRPYGLGHSGFADRGNRLLLVLLPPERRGGGEGARRLFELRSPLLV